MNKYFVLIIILISHVKVSYSATFCVTTSAGLQNALNSANTNNQHNLIKIAEGNYTTPGSQFSYNANNSNAGWDLAISGGWTDFFDNPCGQQLSGSPFLTILDGNSNNRVMRIIASGSADITVSNLMFLNGVVGNSYRGGGLEIRSTQNDHTGNLKLERNAFINNEADFGSAFTTNGFNKMVIRNNLFVANNAIAGFAVDLLQNDGLGIYYTNNTLIYNTQVQENTFGAGVDIAVNGSSKAAVYNNLSWGNEFYDLRLRGTGDHFLHDNDTEVRVGVTPLTDSGNFSSPPQFDTGILNYTPSLSSPLVNKGRIPPFVVPLPTPFQLAWGLGDVDMLGNTRIQGGRVDIGAYESSPEVPIFVNSFE